MATDIWMTDLGEVKLSPREAKVLKDAEDFKFYSPLAKSVVDAAVKFAEWKYR